MKKTILTCFSLLFGIINVIEANANKRTDSTYTTAIKTWHQTRIQNLKSENGWLNLAGLFWLEEGDNTFGSDKSNTIVFPKGDAFLGKFVLRNGEVFAEIIQTANVTFKEQKIGSLKIFPDDKNIILQHQSLRWFVIKRGNKFGIRLRDLESSVVKHFTDINTYPIKENWLIKAKLVKGEAGKKIAITDVLGQTNMQDSPGTLVFSFNGKEYSLDAVDSDNELFIIFKDKTSGKDTYGAGRFLYAEKPKENSDGSVYLDFNKAINPPCAFTEFATCPLAPKQNWLSVAITAGEKKFGNH
jgi:uncharacterized protein